MRNSQCVIYDSIEIPENCREISENSGYMARTRRNANLTDQNVHLVFIGPSCAIGIIHLVHLVDTVHLASSL